MYTSGWPKIQKKCCQSIGSPPPDGTKKLVPKNRSNMSRMSATVMTGNASSSRTWVMKLIQTNIGMRISVMPGRPHVDDGHEEVDRRRQRRDAEDLQAHAPEVDVGPGENCREVRLA